MLEVVEKLLALQDRDQRIRSFRTELSNIPEERKSREKQLAASADRLEQAKTRARQIEVEKKTLEGDAQAKRDAIIRYRQQQLQTKKNEEYSALAHEIEAAEKVITAIEDKELEMMEEAESLKPEIEVAEKIHKEDKDKIAQVLAGLETKQANLESRITEIEADRGRFSEGIDEDVLDRYQRLFQTKHGAAVVPLEHDVCTGCHMKVTTQTSVQIKAEKEIVHCGQCGRILYFPA